MMILRDKICLNPREYEYLLYFTAAHGKEPGQAGPPVIKHLCDVLNMQLDDLSEDESLLVDVAFECHDELAITPIVDFLSQKTSIELFEEHSSSSYTEHTLLGYMYILALCGRKMVKIPHNFIFNSIPKLLMKQPLICKASHCHICIFFFLLDGRKGRSWIGTSFPSCYCQIGVCFDILSI